MNRSAEAWALFKHLRHRDVDTKIKQSRDDLLLIMQSEHRQLDLKIDNLRPVFDARTDALESRIDARFDALESKQNMRFDALEGRMDGFDRRMDRVDDRMDVLILQVVSMKKWAFGLFMVVLIAIIGLVAPIYFPLFFQAY